MIRVAMVALILLMTTAGPALAQDSAREQAVSHYNAAEAHFKAGTFDQAVEEYKKSYALEPAPLLLFNIALANENASARDEAISYYEQYLAADSEGVKANEARARALALRRARESEANNAAKRSAELKKLRARIVTLKSSGQHRQLVGELRALYLLEPTPLLIFEIADAYRLDGDVDAAYSEFNKYLESGDQALVKQAQQHLDELEAIRAKRLVAVTRTKEPSIILPASVSGAAVVLLTVGAIFGSRASSIENDLNTELKRTDPNLPPVNSSDPRFDDGQRAATTANVFYGLGAISTVGAGYLWYRYLRSSANKSNKESPRALLIPMRRGAAVRVSF